MTHNRILIVFYKIFHFLKNVIIRYYNIPFSNTLTRILYYFFYVHNMKNWFVRYRLFLTIYLESNVRGKLWSLDK